MADLDQGFLHLLRRRATFSTDPKSQGVQPGGMPNWRGGFFAQDVE